ncbi:MAG: MoaD/ThiS family protein [Deltaproteobacteria bacterium]|nr:MoaD/ThiS family protein [Deltaproteobacteria bacterium]
MTIELRFFAGLRQFLPGGTNPAVGEFAEGATVADVLRTYRVPEDKPRILLVNGRHALLDQVLRDGDVLSAFPPVAGG